MSASLRLVTGVEIRPFAGEYLGHEMMTA